jgi:hypothetical protein
VTGWGWNLIEMPDRWSDILPQMLRTALAWGDGNLEVLELAWVLWAHTQMGGRFRGLLSAGGGETFQYNAWKQELLKMRAGRSSRVGLDDFITMRLLRSSIDRSLFASDPTDEIRAELRQRLTAWGAPTTRRTTGSSLPSCPSTPRPSSRPRSPRTTAGGTTTG